MARRDKFITEMIVNMDCQHKDIFVIIFLQMRLRKMKMQNLAPKSIKSAINISGR